MLTDRPYVFCAAVDATLRLAVEELFFFNPGQSVLIAAIRASIERHGPPEIVEREGKVWIGVRSGTMQCLFACDPQRPPGWPAAVALFGRTTPDALSIAHLAVDPDYGPGNGVGDPGAGLVLIEKIREIGHSINGVQRIGLPYRAGLFLPIGKPSMGDRR